LLGLAGGALGALLAHWGVKALVAPTPPSYPLVAETRVDGQVLGLTLLLSPATGLLFGPIPALSRSGARPAAALKAVGRTAPGGTAQSGLRSLLVLVQVALAAVLAIGAGCC
jgi:hypothetical protein